MPRDRGSKHRDHFSPSIMNKFFLPLFPISRFLSTFQCCVSSRLCMNMGTKSSEWAEWVDNRSIAYRCLSLHCLHLLLKINKLVKTNKQTQTHLQNTKKWGTETGNQRGVNESRPKFLSKFNPSAYIPKSPKPSSVLTKVWNSYEKLNQNKRPRTSERNHEANWKQIWKTAELICLDWSDRCAGPVWPVAPRKPPKT